jgi:hypothetical protein
MAQPVIFSLQRFFMATTQVSGNILPARDPRALQSIREKFREVFGCETSMKDEALVQRYRVSGDGDLIMILR